MSDDVSSPLDPTDEAITDAELEEEEEGELEAEDDLLDAETDVPEEIDGGTTEADVDDAEIADPKA